MSLLLDLPLELREKILEHVVSDGICKLSFDMSQFLCTLPVKVVNRFHTPWAGLAGTNKQLNAELNSSLLRHKPRVRGVGMSDCHGESVMTIFAIQGIAQGFRIIHDPNNDHCTRFREFLPLVVFERGPDGVWRKGKGFLWQCSVDYFNRIIWTHGDWTDDMGIMAGYLCLGAQRVELIRKSLNMEIGERGM